MEILYSVGLAALGTIFGTIPSIYVAGTESKSVLVSLILVSFVALFSLSVYFDLPRVFGLM